MKISELLNEQTATFIGLCRALKTMILQHAEPQEKRILQDIPIELSSDPLDWDKIYGLTKSRKIIIDEEEFYDAPREVLIWLIAHELAHMLFNHTGQEEPELSQQQEMDADMWANDICKRMNVTKVPVFTWLHRRKDEQGRTELERRQALERDPANADFFKGRSHPTIDRRIKQGKDMGIEISRNTDQIEWLIKHLA